MKFKPIAASMAAFAVLATAVSVPAIAQPAGYYNGGGWDRDAFWRDAPGDAYARIGFLQSRIDRGVADGSLDRYEARRSQGQLNAIRHDADRMRWHHHGNFTPADYDYIQNRLDQLSRQLHWRRQNAWNAGSAPGGNYVTDYDASHYYRDGPNYNERRLADSDEVYRGSDGRYYCKRNDGTTGLIVGGAAGGVLGNIIDGGHNRVAGTLIGGALGALAGKSIAQDNDIRCR